MRMEEGWRSAGGQWKVVGKEEIDEVQMGREAVAICNCLSLSQQQLFSGCILSFECLATWLAEKSQFIETPLPGVLFDIGVATANANHSSRSPG
jgi:hypothetical protein